MKSVYKIGGMPQSNPVNVTAFGSMLGIPVTVVPNAGHMLPKEYVGNLLARWL
jgi:hypothetical protein